MLENLSKLETAMLHREPLENFLYLSKVQRVIWGFDSEFLSSGRLNHSEDVHTVQFSNGDDSFVLESADDLKRWIYNHHRIKVLYGFVILPDLGSIEEWLGSGSVHYRVRGSQTIGTVQYRSFKVVCYDARPLLQSFGIRRLEDAGANIGYPKLPKPLWLGLRNWESKEEHEQFLEYARADAIITSRICKWLYDNFNADPQVHASSGTLARDIFQMPKRLKRKKHTVQLSPLEQKVKHACYAGRSEGFRTGYMRNVTYNDVRSLYPCSLSITHALEICGVQTCKPSDLCFNELNTRKYGWVEGTFKSQNDLWGIPLRGRNNFYAVGTVTGFYSTFDLIASKAEIMHIAHAFKPVFEPSPLHEKYVKMTLERVEGKLEDKEKMFAKAVLNSLSGKLGQSHPIARTSNFFAYNTLLAHSHAIMSRLFDKCKTDVLAMDTDSIFSYNDMSGKQFELSDGAYSIPLIMDVKGKGDLSFFRSKNYILKTSEGKNLFGRHGWVYFLEDFLKLADGSTTELYTRQDIKHTLLTRQREALKMAKGRWRTKPVTLTLEKIKSLLKADAKRRRATYDSYQLVMEKRSIPSQAWNYDKLLLDTENPILGE